MNYEVINFKDWNRSSQYLFFKEFEEPFTGVTCDVDVTKAYENAKLAKFSFFQYYLHKSLLAANDLRPFRLRIVNDELRLYEKIHASATISRADGTFGFSHIEFEKELTDFSREVVSEKERIAEDYNLFPPVHKENVIHFSAMPWLQFTSVSHARKYARPDSCPKISFGKVYKVGRVLKMPVSIHVHHGLMDGRDIGRYVDRFQALLNEG